MSQPGQIASQIAGPTAPQARIAGLDITRGAALLGIFLMNIEGMADTLVQSMGGIDARLTGADWWADAAIYVLVQGKFYTLFSLLFGIGFVLMSKRSEPRVFVRRMAVLGVIGLIHGVLIWSGDILLSYAIIGLALLLFREVSVRWLWRIGGILYALAVLMLAGSLLLVVAMQHFGDFASLAEMYGEVDAAQRAAFGAGSYWRASGQRVLDVLLMMFGLMQLGPVILAMFLFGMAWSKSGALDDMAAHLPLYRRALWLGFGVGLPLMLLAAWLAPDIGDIHDLRGVAGMSLAWVAQLLMCFGYFAALMLIARQRPNLLGWLAPVGRMALTVYLLQSLISTWVFYGYGLGWFGEVSRAWQVVYVLAVFAVLVLFCHLWLARFRYGPMEWLWRWGSYGVRPALRR
ncbi:MAG: DUF418 domain-containing protein [Pseudomonadota bacterium]|nr:DUF418 domain-containing protein [Pseudomonadota bacterium]